MRLFILALILVGLDYIKAAYSIDLIGNTTSFKIALMGFGGILTVIQDIREIVK